MIFAEITFCPSNKPRTTSLSSFSYVSTKLRNAPVPDILSVPLSLLVLKESPGPHFVHRLYFVFDWYISKYYVFSHVSVYAMYLLGGAVASWLVRSTPDRVVRVRVLAGDIVLCSWARHFTLTVPLSTQVYKWVPANLMLGVTLRWTSIPSRGE